MDDIDALVDWQLASRKLCDIITNVCRMCLAQWTAPISVCPECGTRQ